MLKSINMPVGLEQVKKALASYLVSADQAQPTLGVSTGLPSLDDCLIWKGFPKGALSLLWGANGSGATSLWSQAALQLSLNQRWSAWIDSPNINFCPWSLVHSGADFSKILMVSGPPSAKKLFWVLQELMSLSLFDLIGCDLGAFQWRPSQLLKLQRLARRYQTALVFRSTGSTLKSSVYSLVIQTIHSRHYGRHELLIERALHRPTPHCLRVELQPLFGLKTLIHPPHSESSLKLGVLENTLIKRRKNYAHDVHQLTQSRSAVRR